MYQAGLYPFFANVRDCVTGFDSVSVFHLTDKFVYYHLKKEEAEFVKPVF